MTIIFSLVFLVFAIILFSASLALSIVKIVDHKNEFNLKFLIVIFLIFGTLSLALSASLAEIKLSDKDKEYLSKLFPKILKEKSLN